MLKEIDTKDDLEVLAKFYFCGVHWSTVFPFFNMCTVLS